MPERPTPPGRPVGFRVATESDDAELRRLLRDNPVPGSFSLALLREPCFFHGAATEGDVFQTMVAFEEGSDRLCGLGSRAVRDAWVDGDQVRLGYFGQLRIDREARGRSNILTGGFEALREMREDGETPYLVTTIIEGNEAARRALTSGRPGMPVYAPGEVLCTLALPLRRRVRETTCAGVEVQGARPDQVGAIADCLQRNYRRYQFAPVWRAEDLNDPGRCRGLAPGDFLVALRGGRMVGCLATWDQSVFKQTVVHGYSGALKVFRPLVNLAAPFVGLPRLPAVGNALPHAYFSHVAVDDEDPAVLAALLSRAFNRALGKGWSYVTLAFAERNPLLTVVKKGFRHLEYRSRIYLVHWDDGSAAVSRIGDGVPHLELAVL